MSHSATTACPRVRPFALAAALLVLAAFSGEGGTGPASTTPGHPDLESSSVPFHDHGVDLSFAGRMPCADFGVDIQAEFDYDITADVTFFPEREVFRIHFRQVVLTHRNLETGATVVSRNSSTEVYDLEGGRDVGTALSVTITGLAGNYKGPDGRILIKHAGRLVLGPSGVEFEAGQHPEFEPDFITFICTALS